MHTSGLAFQLLDGGQAAAAADELLVLHGDVYGADGDGERFARQFRVWRRQPGFMLAEGRSGGYLVGFAAGMPLRPSTSWWRELTTPVPAQITTEYAGRTFAITELLVRAAWRRQGIGRAVHDLLLTDRPEERATLTIPPDAIPAQRALQSWGWQKVARTSGPHPGSTALDVLILVLPAR